MSPCTEGSRHQFLAPFEDREIADPRHTISTSNPLTVDGSTRDYVTGMSQCVGSAASAYKPALKEEFDQWKDTSSSIAAPFYSFGKLKRAAHATDANWPHPHPRTRTPVCVRTCCPGEASSVALQRRIGLSPEVAADGGGSSSDINTASAACRSDTSSTLFTAAAACALPQSANWM